MFKCGKREKARLELEVERGGVFSLSLRPKIYCNMGMYSVIPRGCNKLNKLN
jgi:hypothetical protein